MPVPAPVFTARPMLKSELTHAYGQVHVKVLARWCRRVGAPWPKWAKYLMPAEVEEIIRKLGAPSFEILASEM